MRAKNALRQLVILRTTVSDLLTIFVLYANVAVKVLIFAREESYPVIHNAVT